MTAKVINIKSGENYDVYIGRGSRYGNPFSHLKYSKALYIVDSREEAIKCYEAWILENPKLIEDIKKNLKNKILACYCKPLACHGDILLKIANEV